MKNLHKKELRFKFKEDSKLTNRKIRAVNGNRMQSFHVAHWNLGAKKWPHKLVEIEALLNEKQPDLCFVSEANLWINTPST